MKIMCDTNIIIDVLLKREPFVDESCRVLSLCLLCDRYLLSGQKIHAQHRARLSGNRKTVGNCEGAQRHQPGCPDCISESSLCNINITSTLVYNTPVKFMRYLFGLLQAEKRSHCSIDEHLSILQRPLCKISAITFTQYRLIRTRYAVYTLKLPHFLRDSVEKQCICLQVFYKNIYS